MFQHHDKTRSGSKLPLVVFVAAIALVTSSSVWAAGKTGYGRGKSGAKTGAEPAVTVPPVDPAAAQQAQQSLTEARAERKKAEDNLASVAARVRAESDKSPEMAQALANVKAAEAEYTAAAKPSLEKVQATPEYKAANEARSHDQVQIDQLHGTAGAEAQIAALAQDAMAQASAANKLESDAVAKDPAALAAKAKVTAANAKLGELRGQMNGSLTKNPDWVAAKKALDDAVQKLQTAQANYNQETGKLGAAQAAHNAAAAQKQKVDQEYAGTQKKPAGNATNTNKPNQ
jgi:hypothetical protein